MGNAIAEFNMSNGEQHRINMGKISTAEAFEAIQERLDERKEYLALINSTKPTILNVNHIVSVDIYKVED